MDAMTPTLWLIAALSAMALAALITLAAWQWRFTKRPPRNQVPHSRTADARVINKESRQLLRGSNQVVDLVKRLDQLKDHEEGERTAARRIRAGEAPPSTTPTPGARPNLHQVRARAIQAAIHDMGHGNKRRPGPYTIGTAEHAEWCTHYNAVFMPTAVPPTSKQYGHLHAVNSVPVQPQGAEQHHG